MHLMRACLLECLVMIFGVGSTKPELPTLGRWAPAERIDECNKDATAAMLENPSLPADSSTVQATQKDQQASCGDDSYRICHILGAVIPLSTHSPPPHPPHSHAPPDPEVLKTHSQTNHGLATNIHALVGDESIPWDFRAITHPLDKGSNSQDPLNHLFPLWAEAEQSYVGPQFTPDSGHTSSASIPPNFLPFSKNPYPPSSKTAPQPWDQDTITLNNPYNPPAESSTAQEDHHTFRAISHNYPISYSTVKPMSSHPPLLHPIPQAGPEMQTAYSQNAGLGTRRSKPTGLFGHKPNPLDLQKITNQLTNVPKSQDSFENHISLSPSSTSQFMPQCSYTNLASGFSHILHDSQQPSFKTTTPQSKQRTQKIITNLKPSTKPLKKKPPHAKIWTKNSSSLSQMNHLIPLPSDTELYAHQEKPLPLPGEINEITPHHGSMEFELMLFEDVSTKDAFQHAGGAIFQHEIDQLPGKLLIIQEEKFEEMHRKFIKRKGHSQSYLTASNSAELLQKILIDKLLEFQGDMELWHCRWRRITSCDFEKDPPLPHTASAKMEKIVEFTFSMYLFYVEMICSIVPRESTKIRDLKAELKSAQESFTILSNNPSKLLQKRLVKSPHEVWDRYTLPILWTYLGHWMGKERPGVFKMEDKSDDVVTGIKSFFNRAFAFSYSAVSHRYIGKNKS